MDRPVLPWGAPHAERADAARNRRHLLATARQMLAEQDPDKLTMDALAERAGLGKGTVFRRFGTRAGIFAALLDDDERALQQQVLAGAPPLGPGAAPLDRLIAYGRARTGFLIAHRDIARATLDGHQPIPGRSQSPLSQLHIRVLLGQMNLDRRRPRHASRPAHRRPGRPPAALPVCVRTHRSLPRHRRTDRAELAGPSAARMPTVIPPVTTAADGLLAGRGQQ